MASDFAFGFSVLTEGRGASSFLLVFFFSLFSSNGTFLNLPSIVLMNKRDIKSSSCSRGSVTVEQRSENLPRFRSATATVYYFAPFS